MQILAFSLVNIGLVALFLYLMKGKNYLSFFEGGKWWLTWLAVGIITLMDELTSIYYAPSEAFRFIGVKAIIYISVTSVVIRFLSTRMVEIAEILEANNIRGGGVYSFSYLVLGPTVSFVAISSILTSYVLTATISTVSAVENGTTFLHLSVAVRFFMSYGVIWAITFLNILGIKENARFTFYIFILAAFVLLNLVTGGLINFDQNAIATFTQSVKEFAGDFDFSKHNIFGAYSNVIVGIGSCILAYSGIESVLQTASLTKSWHETRKSYLFLALTVGIVTPIVAVLILSGGKAFVEAHETDLVPAYATSIMGPLFGAIVSALASITLIMAVNTAMVASAELIEKVVEKYNYNWLIKINKRQSYYRIHILNAIFYSIILTVTSGSQAVLAEMYAVGLVASFCINVLSILIYRYSKGTKEITYHTSRIGTVILFVILASTFVYIVLHRPYGTLLWFIIALFFVIGGIKIAKTRAPEIKIKRMTDNPMDIIFRIFESDLPESHIYFRRWREELDYGHQNQNNIFVSFYSARTDKPEKLAPNHLWLSIPQRAQMFDQLEALLNMIDYEVPKDYKVHIHFGWPLSSWYDRLSTGVMVYRMISMPRKFPRFEFHIEYESSSKKLFLKKKNS